MDLHDVGDAIENELVAPQEDALKGLCDGLVAAHRCGNPKDLNLVLRARFSLSSSLCER
jgi:hypothetical protein